MAQLPEGDTAPTDGAITLRHEVHELRAFGVYLHVPFCRVRCGYCDFNTYTAEELRGAKRSEYATQAVRELEFAAQVLKGAGAPAREAQTVFFGGGTPTILPTAHIRNMLDGVRENFGIADGAEVTIEANPDSVTPQALEQLAEAGITRVSFGVQSAVPHVLAVLERTHDPARVPEVVRAAQSLGLEASIDLIYGTPGESLDDLQRSLDLALSLETGHVSAYALIIEEGTKLARQIRRGEVPMPDDDEQADAYELVDRTLSAAGFEWYEVSNFARSEAQRSRHNLAYWRGDDWWGIGPGAHSHIDGTRFWNVKHPAAYRDRIEAGVSPALAREELGDDVRLEEDVLLGIRLRDGFEIDRLPASARPAVAELIADELIEPQSAFAGRIRLTLRGRLLADAVVRTLLR